MAVMPDLFVSDISASDPVQEPVLLESVGSVPQCIVALSHKANVKAGRLAQL